MNPVVSNMGQDMYIIYERPLRLNDVKAYISSINGSTMRVEVHNNTPRHLMNVKLRPVYFDGRAHSEYIVVPGAVDPYTDYVFDVPVTDSNLFYQLAYLMPELPNPVYDTEIETVVSVTNAGRLAGGSIEGGGDSLVTMSADMQKGMMYKSLLSKFVYNDPVVKNWYRDVSVRQ